jgi:16S rRNA (adenine1518-N6/adenine1519-N6)-dimethyltransferase
MKRRTPKLGQHFLTGLWAARKLAEAAAVREGETIVEIGPGKGALTRELLATGAHVAAIEKDEALVTELETTFVKELATGQLEIIAGDVRDFSPTFERYVVAANIPYYITGEIIRRFLTAANQPRALALLVQKEVAERILARNSKESILSLSVKAYGKPRIAAKVARGNFSPPPKVDSAILVIDGVSKDFFHSVSERAFFDVVRAGFSSKRKFLANNLAGKYGKSAALDALSTCGIGAKTRAEDVPIEKWRDLAGALSAPASVSKRRPNR